MSWYHTKDTWAAVGGQEMLWCKKQKYSYSHRQKEKSAAVGEACFMVLLTLQEQKRACIA